MDDSGLIKNLSDVHDVHDVHVTETDSMHIDTVGWGVVASTI